MAMFSFSAIGERRWMGCGSGGLLRSVQYIVLSALVDGEPLLPLPRTDSPTVRRE